LKARRAIKFGGVCRHIFLQAGEKLPYITAMDNLDTMLTEKLPMYDETKPRGKLDRYTPARGESYR
jgi:hypothetical protein